MKKAQNSVVAQRWPARPFPIFPTSPACMRTVGASQLPESLRSAIISPQVFTKRSTGGLQQAVARRLAAPHSSGTIHLGTGRSSTVSATNGSFGVELEIL
jgi:hypothetical protein